ncbi:MAG: pyruvate kinase [Bacillota bacterium]|nr:pyruvate kinase [Bacillota bacterium]
MSWTFKKTKIVCTLGPACESEEILTQMARAGMDVARLNFSHGSYEEHGERIRRVRRVSEATGKLLGVMIDIQGPKLRIGAVPGGRLQLQKGQVIVLTTDPAGEADQKIFVPYPPLTRQVEPGMVIYLDDAKLELAVEEVEGSDLRCRVVIGGGLESHKGVSIPGGPIDLPAVTEKDRRDLRFAVANQVDLVAVSFVRRAEHLRQVRQLIRESGGRQALIAKIENDEGLANLDEIIEEADGLMVARGDLGVSLPPEEVPMIQKMIIQRCNRAGKPVITATQMLDSMKNSPRPTAEEDWPTIDGPTP